MVDNPFDGYSNSIFDRVNNIMGRDAIWLPSSGPPQQTGKILFNEPTEKEKLNQDIEYDPNQITIEYKHGLFTGLWDAVRAGNQEQITIDGINYICRQALSIFDGRTYKIIIERA